MINVLKLKFVAFFLHKQYLKKLKMSKKKQVKSIGLYKRWFENFIKNEVIIQTSFR